MLDTLRNLYGACANNISLDHVCIYTICDLNDKDIYWMLNCLKNKLIYLQINTKHLIEKLTTSVSTESTIRQPKFIEPIKCTG